MNKLINFFLGLKLWESVIKKGFKDCLVKACKSQNKWKLSNKVEKKNDKEFVLWLAFDHRVG